MLQQGRAGSGEEVLRDRRRQRIPSVVGQQCRMSWQPASAPHLLVPGARGVAGWLLLDSALPCPRCNCCGARSAAAAALSGE